MLGAVSRDAADVVADALLADADAHEAERYDDIGERYDEVEAQLQPLPGRSDRPVRFAMDFWDGWIDDGNHDWCNYDGIEQHDWPQHARLIAACLRAAEVPDDSVLRQHFVLPPRRSWRERLAPLLRRIRAER